MDLPQVCFSCKKNSQQVRIYDAVKEARSVKVCENCARMEGVIIIRKPTSNQVQGANKSTSVYSRLQRLAGLSQSQREEQFKVQQMFPSNKQVAEESRKQTDEFSEYSIKK